MTTPAEVERPTMQSIRELLDMLAEAETEISNLDGPNNVVAGRIRWTINRAVRNSEVICE